MPYKLPDTKNINPFEPSCKKKAYHSFEEAQDMVRFINETRVSKAIKPYKCNICGLWHLTSRAK